MKKMKVQQLVSLLVVALFFTSCMSVRVTADYDKKANFDGYTSYAYLKKNIDRVQISDLDKKRILYAIDDVMAAKGFSKSKHPDILITFFTKEVERVDAYNSVGFGVGRPYFGMGINLNRPIHSTEGTLYINIINAQTKEMIWQGEGVGYLTKNTEKKDERITEFVTKILAQYPPNKN